MTREHEELCERLTANTEKYPGFENMNTQAAAAIRSLSEQVTTIARVERALRATLGRADKALRMAYESMTRESWQDGPTIEAARAKLNDEIENIKHEITVESAEYQLRWAAQKASEARKEAVQLREQVDRLAEECKHGRGLLKPSGLQHAALEGSSLCGYSAARRATDQIPELKERLNP